MVVQELVPADAAGILFTANPVTGARGQVMINAAWGLGEAIVGGQVTPDTIVVDRASGRIIEQQISEKDMIRAGVFIGVDKTGDLKRLPDAAAAAQRMHDWAVRQGMPDDTHAKLITDVSDKVRPDQIIDVKCAVRYLRAHADDLVKAMRKKDAHVLMKHNGRGSYHIRIDGEHFDAWFDTQERLEDVQQRMPEKT